MAVITGAGQVRPGAGAPPIQRSRTQGESSRTPSVRLGQQIFILLGAIVIYFGVRHLTEGSVSAAVANAARVVDFEEALGLHHEQWLQDTFAGSSRVSTVFNWIYIWGHWPVIAVTLVWLARRHQVIYLRTRNAMILSGAVGMVIFATFPVAPPRLAHLGMVDTVSVSSHAYRVLQPPMFTNQYAAVPSLHVGWDLLMGIAIAIAARRVWVKAIGIAMPVAMTLAVVLTANHYIVDAFAGAALTVSAWYAVRWWTRRRELRLQLAST